MKVLVDTAIWSLALRRRHHIVESAEASQLVELVLDSRVAIIGAIRQELLSGMKEHTQFEQVRERLRAFSDTEVISTDYEEAAAFFSRCRGKGIQGSNTDFLICAVAVRSEFSIFTTDEDFVRFARVLPIVLHQTHG
ncbi:MAG: hypothetical protein QOI24_2262 [Acidobacteriota bacterium]|nr:hypothetical protein [Acidobacteriota bacterium]